MKRREFMRCLRRGACVSFRPLGALRNRRRCRPSVSLVGHCVVASHLGRRFCAAPAGIGLG